MSGHWTAPTKYNIKCCLTLLYSCVLEATLGEWVHSLAWWSYNVASTCSSRRAFQGHLTWLGRRGAMTSGMTSSSWFPWLTNLLLQAASPHRRHLKHIVYYDLKTSSKESVFNIYFFGWHSMLLMSSWLTRPRSWWQCCVMIEVPVKLTTKEI